jgi:hypothetical protein
MMKVIRYLLVVSCWIFYLPAQTMEEQEAKVQLALKAMGRGEQKEALRLFKEVRDTEPYHPLAPLGALANEWMVNQGEYGYNFGNRQVLKDIDTVILDYRRRMIIEPDNYYLKYFLGLANGLRARIQLAQKNYLGVLISGYNIIRYFKSALAENPNDPDIIIAFGVFNYYVGLSSGFMKIASYILQISGSKEEGLAQIQEAALHGNYSRYEARGLLAYIYLNYEGDSTAAHYWLDMLLDEFPNNYYYNYMSANLELQTQNPRIELQLAQITQRLPTMSPYARLDYEQRLQLLHGIQALLENDLVSAESELRQFIEKYYSEMDIDLGNAYLQLGKVYDLMGQRQAAIKCYQQTVKLNNRTIMIGEAKKYLNQPYTRQ